MSYTLTEIGAGLFTGRLAIGPAPIAERDIDELKAWGAEIVVTLTPDDELTRLGGSTLHRQLGDAGVAQVVLPIVDFSTPDEGFCAAWVSKGAELLSALRSGKRVLIHCRAGLGRSGTVAARLLIDAGMAPDQAIETVRTTRPGAIETLGQVAWLKGSAG